MAVRASEGPLLLGVRHHGPGSARAVLAALESVRPAAVLVEGPPEGDALLPLAGHLRMRPPVALLAHAVDDPGRSAFWPFADFSPEWVAIRWSLARGVPVRFMDLPAAHSLALTDRREEGAGEDRAIDPIRILARTAGHDDPEGWWEDVVEHRGADGRPPADPCAPFAALAEAMTALREAHGDGGHPQEAVREACMRLRLRAARKEFGDRVAVVCGAWHVPALASGAKVAADRALLRGMPKVRVELTWVPWTHRRLSRYSGYGAGIDSPGWYAHLFASPDRPVERWMTRTAGLLRDADRPVSGADVIEAVRLADALAVVRGRPAVGLAEATDAVRAVMCEGSDVPLALVRDELVVGTTLGEVPDTAPAVPLQRDLDKQQRRLRLRPEAARRELELDLRKDTDAARSRLLHRLRILGVDWGAPAAGRGSTGTFRESWRLRWEPELFVRIAEAGVWGTTVLDAATAKAESDAVSARVLAEVTGLAERCLLAGLTRALPVVMRALADRAALDTDVRHLADALPSLARSLRYGDVRSTGTAALGAVAVGLAERVCVGLPPACTGLAPDAAAEALRRLDGTHTAMGMLAGADGAEGLPERWVEVLRGLAVREAVAGMVRGRATRLLLDDGRLTESGTERLMSQALSPGTPSAEAADWIEGFLGGAAGGGLLLVHDERLRRLVDSWLTGLPADAFTGVLPLLRRTFAAFPPGARRTLGDLVRRGGAAEHASGKDTPAAPGFGAALDEERADAVVPVLRLLLGLDPPDPPCRAETDRTEPGGADPDRPASDPTDACPTELGPGVQGRTQPGRPGLPGQRAATG
ncbi:DUF5682 family protein [Streptomyces sp. NPDC059166]|uniref:DUF5682 family protein n=1 Tax=Streptomyces sp. NPDC059166 TaxID=3346752 RepID=UPI0036739C34